MMKTVGNDLVRSELESNRKWYILLGILLVVFGAVLLGSLAVATLTVIYLFGILMMIGGVVHIIGAFKFFNGGARWLWAIFGVLYLIAGYYAFDTPIVTAIVLTSLLGVFLIIAGIFRTVNAFVLKPIQGWGWTLFSGIITFIAGIMILTTPDSPFWVLGLFLAIDILFQGINYLAFGFAIKQLPHSTTSTR